MARQSDSAKLLAIGLLNYSDDEGYFYADAALIRSALRPFDDDSTIIRRCLDDLSRIGYCAIVNHPTHGDLGKVIAFASHQRVDRPKLSVIKELFDSTNDRRTIDDQSPLEGKGKERKGKEGSGGEEEESPPPKLDFPESPKHNPNRMATFKQVIEFAESQPMGIPRECSESFFDRMEAEGWVTPSGLPLNDWRARFRSWSTNWINNQRKAK